MNRLATLVLLIVFLAAAPAQAQWTPETTVVLKGKVVSMHRGVRSGQVVIKGGKIQAILSRSATPPDGAIVIETTGFIYPGLINMHDHARYSFLRLYPLPQHYSNSHQWPFGKSYDEHVNQPMRVLNSSETLAKQSHVMRYAEIKAVVGGHTAVQGVWDDPATNKSLVRNVELENFGEDHVDHRSLRINRKLWDVMDTELPRIKSQQAWLFHLAEGIDAHARRQWSNPEWDPAATFSANPGTWNVPGVVEAGLVFPGLVGVHCTGMQEQDFADWRARINGPPKIVWSPTSNLLLYGKTTDIRAAQKARALIALGTDWAPSGTKNLLWELKTVDRINRTSSPRLFRTDRQILELATKNPAKMLGWGDKLGQLRAGFHADIIVADKLHRSGYRSLILAREVNIQLVMVDGDPIYGDEAVLQKLKVYEGRPRYEAVPGFPASRVKVIDLRQDPTSPLAKQSLTDLLAGLNQAARFEPQSLADAWNAGAEAEDGTITHAVRDAIKKSLKRYYTQLGEVPARILDADADLTVDDAKLYLSKKWKHVKPLTNGIDPLVTDAAWIKAVEANLHWHPPYAVELDLRRYLPVEELEGDTQGAAGALGGATSD